MPPTSLASCQETQWEFMSGLAPDDPGRSQHVVVDNRYLRGPLDRSALRQAFADVTERHEALRLAFDAIGPDPRVRIDDRVVPPVEEADLSGFGEGRQLAAIEELSYRENRRCFDLRAGPLWHAWVVRLDPASHLLSVCLSHIVADGWAPRVFMTDLLAAYGARARTGPPWDPEPLSFAAMHELQARRLQPTAERLRYWRERVVPRPPDAQALARLRARPDADLMARERLHFRFPAATAVELRRVAWRARTTPYVALMAAYHLLLCLTTGRDRSVINTALLGRRTDGERRAVFQYSVDPYVCAELSSRGSLRDTVRAMDRATREAVAHMVSYKNLARTVNPGFDASRPWPAFHFCDGKFISAAFLDPRLSVSGLQVEQAYIPGERPPDHARGPVMSELPDPLARAWGARGGPGIAIGPGRHGGLLRFNGDIHPVASMRELLDQYLWIVEVLAWRPETEVRALREQHASRFVA
jgi:hypothetical protein